MKTIALSDKSEGNLPGLCDLVIKVPSKCVAQPGTQIVDRTYY